MTENKSFLETVAESNKPESFSKEKFEYVNDGKKKKKIIITFAIILLLLIGSYTVYYIMDRVTVPKLASMSLTEASD